MSSSSSTSTGWPRFVVMKDYVCADKKSIYLRQISKEESIAKGVPPTSLINGEQDISSPLLKFEFISAKKNPKGVHIRCCNNNKFLKIEVKKDAAHDDPWFIFASSEDPIEEDSPEQPCTWFEIKEHPNMPENYCFTHVASNRIVVQDYDSNLLYASSKYYEYFRFLDWESLVIFPKNNTLAFLGENNKYLSPNGDNHVMLFNKDAVTDDSVTHQIFSVYDGYIRIKNNSTGKFFRLEENNWIRASSDDPSANDDNTLFWPVKVTDNTVALLVKASEPRRFAKLYTNEYENGLSAIDPEISSFAKLVVVDTVGSRSIYGIEFRPDEGRIYNVQALEKAHASAQNYDKEKENTLTLTFSYKTSRSTTYSVSGSLKIGVHTSLEVSEIPLVAKESIGFSYEFTTTIGWETTKTVETATESTYTVIVPPKSRTTVTLLATQGMCDVPFSYTQRDILRDGSVIIHKLNDGIFTGLNTFNMDFIAESEPLLPKDDNNQSLVKNCITQY
ncbi:hypothetical protein CsatA_005730 [Cannabis sativa]